MASIFSTLNRATNALRELARVPARFARASADDINALLGEQRAAGTDPYGRPHAALKRTRPGGAPLDKTGASYDATRARPLAGAGVGIELGGALAFHLEPAESRPARRALPLSGLPARWRARLQASEDKIKRSALPETL